MTLDDIMKEEQINIWYYIEEKKPFDYIKYLRKEYNIKTPFNKMVDNALDDYNNLLKWGVTKGAKAFSLKRLALKVIEQYHSHHKIDYNFYEIDEG